VLVTVAAEGIVDTAVAQKVLSSVGLVPGTVHGQRGKDLLDKSLRGYNAGARFAPWFVLRDLDHDADCAPELVPRLLPAPSANMRLRLAVRSVEAWLLADSKRISAFLHVATEKVPRSPDELADPKQALVNLARESRSREIRSDLVPGRGTTGRVGPAYTARRVEFASLRWRPTTAARRSDSLRRCLNSLASLRS
jgi:hypothetical protein